MRAYHSRLDVKVRDSKSYGRIRAEARKAGHLYRDYFVKWHTNMPWVNEMVVSVFFRRAKDAMMFRLMLEEPCEVHPGSLRR
jgi:hypothetical protein